MSENFLGLDLGTSSVKAAIIRIDGSLLGRASIPFASAGHLVRDPELWFSKTLEAIRLAMRRAESSESLRGGGLEISAMAVSGNGPSMLALDDEYRPIGEASLWCDRAEPEWHSRAEEITGEKLDPSFYLVKAFQLMTVKPALYFSAPEYLAWRLGAEPVSYLSHPYYESFTWDVKNARKLGIDEGLFPPYVEPCSRIGMLNSASAEMTGLEAGIPIVSAFPDFVAALVGSGTMEAGMACDRTGSSEALNLCWPEPARSSSLFSLPHPAAGMWNVSGGISSSGRSMDWFTRLFSIQDEELFTKASEAAPGAGGAVFLPYLDGERAPLYRDDLRAAFAGLADRHGLPEMARALTESIGFALKLTVEYMHKEKMQIDTIRASGRAGAHPWLCQLKADILETPIESLEIIEAETTGSAAAAATGTGFFENLEAAGRSMCRPGAVYEPNLNLAEEYNDAWTEWKAALDCMLNKGG